MSPLYFHKINLYKFHSLFKEIFSHLYIVILNKMARIQKSMTKIMKMCNKMKDHRENRFLILDKKINLQKFCMDS